MGVPRCYCSILLTVSLLLAVNPAIADGGGDGGNYNGRQQNGWSGSSAVIPSSPTASQGTVQPGGVNGQQVIGSLLDLVFGQQGSRTGHPQCIPYPLPAGSLSWQDYCTTLSVADDATWDNVFRNASGPKTQNEPFPLSGCVLGCLVGKTSYNRGVLWGAGAWSGKCVRNNGMDVVNLLTPLPSIGGVVTVLDTFNWSTFLPVVEEYPGVVSTGASIWDALYSLPQTGKIKDAWTITYTDVKPPPVNANSSALEQTMNMYAQLVRGSRDEVRQVAPGFMLGNVLRQPNSYMNPTPLPIITGVRFGLFQVCDYNGNYPQGGNQRDLRPPAHTSAAG